MFSPASRADGIFDFSSRDSLRPPRPLERADSRATARPSFPVRLPKLTKPKQPFNSYHVENTNPPGVGAVKDPAGRLDDLPIAGTTELGRDGSALRMPLQLFDMFEDSLDEAACSLGVVESDIIRDRVQIRQCWLRPNYLSHLAMRFLASA